MILRMNLEIEIGDMDMVEFAAVVDRIKNAAGVKGRIKCSLGWAMSRDVDVSELLTGHSNAGLP